MSPGRSLVKPMPAMAAATTESFTTRRFAVACDVLSKCVKAGTTPPLQQAAGPGTTAFMPGAPAAVHERPRAAAGGGQQLTIFYSGRVVVIDGCTPEKASELIRYAAAAAAPAPQSVPEPAPAPQSVPEPAPALVDMPIARKASLKRFLAKRKDRSAPAPAQASSGRTAEEPSPAKKRKTVERREEASSWLTLGSLGDMHAQ